MTLLSALSNLSWTKSRIECFMAIILGISQRGSVHHHAMASGFAGTGSKAQTTSHIRRIERFFKEQIIDYRCQARIILQIVAPIDLCKLHLVMDRTNWKFGQTDINILVLAVHFPDGSAVPLLWKLLPHQGCSGAAARKELLKLFEELFGMNRIASFTADREFVGDEWISYLVAKKVPFYIRVKDNRLVAWSKDKKRSLKDFFKDLKTDEERHLYKAINTHNLTIVGRRNKQQELIVVVSNQKNPAEIMKIYRTRWRIETMFRNTKTSGYNMEGTHMKDPERIMKLMAAISIAQALALRAGWNAIVQKPTPFKKTVNAPLYSTFTRGFRLILNALNRCIKKALTWLSSLTLSPIPHGAVG